MERRRERPGPQRVRQVPAQLRTGPFHGGEYRYAGPGAHLGGRDGRRAIAGSGAYQIVYFFPQLLSLVVIAVLWGFVYHPNNGLLNGALRSLGLDALTRSWLASPSLALIAVMVVLVWSSVGFYVVLFSAAIDGIPRELFEAPLLDGAGTWATFRTVTLPLVRESVQVAFVYLGIAALDAFAVVQVMTVGPGGPDGATEMIGLSLYRTAFQYGKFGYASAMGVALSDLSLPLGPHRYVRSGVRAPSRRTSPGWPGPSLPRCRCSGRWSAHSRPTTRSSTNRGLCRRHRNGATGPGRGTRQASDVTS
ncbi:carbohydrate ABC transporter permease [Micromonospora sp. NPDC051300]|uniref:carbohydrate ABC transporter permease n=1 Tax=Micromonospora sp. NPDC051300 TaxID=3364286 RepID=UPI0037944E3B